MDVSLILNVHREREMLARTLMSLKEAAAVARAGGISVELVVILDRSDEETRAILRQSRLSSFDDVQIGEIDVGSLGLARNEGCRRATGTYVMLCDGDDLISFNAIEATYKVATASAEKTVLFPRWTVGFGSSYFFVEALDLSLVTPFRFLRSHPYTSRACFRRDVIADVAFQDVRLSSGYAYEDWLFNCELVARGFDFRTVDDVILYYRQAPRSLMFQIAAQSVKTIPPSTLFDPKTFIETCASSGLSKKSAPKQFPPRRGRSFLSTSVFRLLSHAASRIEPGFDLAKLDNCWETAIETLDEKSGLVYYQACKIFDRRSIKCLFFLPEHPTPSEIAIVNEAAGILGPKAIAAVMFSPSKGRAPTLHREVDCVSLSAGEDLDPDGCDAVAIKIIQCCCPTASLHIFADPRVAEFFAKYGRLFPANKKVLYAGEREYIKDGELLRKVVGCSSFLSSNSDMIDLCVVGHQSEIAALEDAFGLRLKPVLLRRRHQPARSREDAVAQTDRASKRVLCLSGPLVGSRPGLASKIAQRLADKGSDLILETRGATAGGAAREPGVSSIAEASAADCVNCLSRTAYLCVIHLCWLDNCLPTILAAAGMGVPNVAPDVGEVGEFMEIGDTGTLIEPQVSEDAAADAYVEAILQIANDPAVRGRIIRGAYDRLEAAYGDRSYRLALTQILEA